MPSSFPEVKSQSDWAGVVARLWRAARAARVSFIAFLRDMRSNEFAQTIGCAAIGILVGVLVYVAHQLVNWLHVIDFGLKPGARLSDGSGIDPVRLALVPVLGGLVLGGTAHLLRNLLSTNIVDPVEANALHGGRMSLTDSLRLLLATIVSNAAGASLGMEAGYSQLGAGLFSRIGKSLHLRREDLRVFTTAGAGAAIAAAFNAPLAGAFYGFELILGSYIPRALAPVAVACLTATLTIRVIGEPYVLFSVKQTGDLPFWIYFLFAALGIAGAGLCVIAMRSVTWAEIALRKLRIPTWLRPALGGLLLSVIAFGFPQVLGSGYGAIQYHIDHQWTAWALFLLLCAKLIASAISISSGFRGGMFSSSLFLGGLYGALAVQALSIFIPALGYESAAMMIVCMGSIAAGIVGAPLTMVFLVLESTGDFAMTIGVLVGVVATSMIVRLTFGYSFSTWRFHQRGLSIRGGHDIGWLADLTVGKLMRADPVTVPVAMSLRDLRKAVPLGAAKQAFAIDAQGQYAGMIDVVAAHDTSLDEEIDSLTAGDLASAPEFHLSPNEDARSALQRFDTARRETLPVLSPAPDGHVIGYLSEAYALKRYAEELEKRRSAELGEQNLFSIGQLPE